MGDIGNDNTGKRQLHICLREKNFVVFQYIKSIITYSWNTRAHKGENKNGLNKNEKEVVYNEKGDHAKSVHLSGIF